MFLVSKVRESPDTFDEDRIIFKFESLPFATITRYSGNSFVLSTLVIFVFQAKSKSGGNMQNHNFFRYDESFQIGFEMEADFIRISHHLRQDLKDCLSKHIFTEYNTIQKFYGLK